MKDIHAAVTEAGCANLVLEEDLSGPSLDIMDVFALVSSGTSRSGATLVNVAYCDLDPEHDKELMHFAESVAANRGLNVRRFDSPADAMKWMEEIVQAQTKSGQVHAARGEKSG